jgi:hypothetical protein
MLQPSFNGNPWNYNVYTPKFFLGSPFTEFRYPLQKSWKLDTLQDALHLLQMSSKLGWPYMVQFYEILFTKYT